MQVALGEFAVSDHGGDNVSVPFEESDLPVATAFAHKLNVKIAATQLFSSFTVVAGRCANTHITYVPEARTK